MLHALRAAVVLLYLCAGVTAVWPRPRHIETGSSVVWWTNDVTILLEGNVPFSEHEDLQQPLQGSDGYSSDAVGMADDSLPRRFNRAVRRLYDDIRTASFVPWKFHLKNHDSGPTDTDDGGTLITQIRVSISDYSLLKETNSTEVYRLSSEVTKRECIVMIDAISWQGALQGFSTMAQLFYLHTNGGIYSPIFPIYILDWPEYEHRGLNLDIARNELTPDDVIRTLEAMRWSKFNKLHLHATDSQSWPLEVPSLPELHKKGAYRADHAWTVKDLERVRKTGDDLGIEVYLEIDMPGHTASIHHSHPDLVAGFDAPLANYSAAEPPAGQLRLNSTAVYEFVDTLLVDILPRAALHSTLFHVGGDELNKNIYALDPTVGSNQKEVLQPLLQQFYDRVILRVKEHNLTPVFWQEALLDWNLTLPKNSIIQVWRPDPGVLESVLAHGHQALFGAASHWYLDCGFGTFLDPSHKQDSLVKPPYNDWCTPYKSWRQVYSYDPLANISSNVHHLVLGGEVHLWGELTDSINLDGKLWPRAAAAGEVLWSGPIGPDGVTEDVTRRLADLRERLVNLGVRAEVVQMTWCLQNQEECVA